MSIRLPTVAVSGLKDAGSLLLLGAVNPRSMAPTISSPTLEIEGRCNYLVVYDPILSPKTPFHYFPLKVEGNFSNPTGTLRILVYPNVLAPGIIILRGRRLYRVNQLELQRGKLTDRMRIKDVDAYLATINEEVTTDAAISANTGTGTETVDGSDVAPDAGVLDTIGSGHEQSEDEVNAIKSTFNNVSSSRSGPRVADTPESSEPPENETNAVPDVSYSEQEAVLSELQNQEGFRFFR